MPLLSRVRDSSTLLFWCLGCKEVHQIDTDRWEFDGNFESPTFSPSYKTWRDPNPKADPAHDPDRKYRDGFLCHSFIKAGMIEYLSDCTHALAGQTVAMLSVEDMR